MWEENIVKIISEKLITDGIIQIKAVTEQYGRVVEKIHVMTVEEWRKAKERGIIG